MYLDWNYISRPYANPRPLGPMAELWYERLSEASSGAVCRALWGVLGFCVSFQMQSGKFQHFQSKDFLLPFSYVFVSFNGLERWLRDHFGPLCNKEDQDN